MNVDKLNFFLFRYILNFLRTNRLIVPQGYKELHMLKEEAKFFGLEDLSSQVDKVIKSRNRKPRPRLSRRLSRSWGSDLTKISTDENGSVIFEDEGSDFFYDWYARGGDVQNWTVVHMLTVCNCAKIIILFETDCSAQFFSLSSCIV